MELYKLTATEVINGLVEDVMNDHPEISKKKAKDLVLNALIYNCVQQEIFGQIEFLIEKV